MNKSLKILTAFTLTILLLASCKPDYVEPIGTTEAELHKNEDGLVSKEVVTKPTIDFDEIFTESSSLQNEETTINEEQTAQETSEKETALLEETTVSLFDMKVEKDDRVFHGATTADTKEYWKYGMTPCEWVYIEPGIQLISNYKPNTSAHYSINSKVSSGLKGCFVPIFTKTETIGDDYDGRIYIFEDYSKEVPENMLFSNKLSSVKYRGVAVSEILKSNMNLTETNNGILKSGDSYLNIIYATDLDKFLE